MLNQSKELLNAVFAPIALNDFFPVSDPERTLRQEQPIEAHVHDCLELGYCYRGTGIFIVENKVLPFRAGDAVVINRRELHTMKSNPGDGCDWYFVNLSPVQLLAGFVREEDAAPLDCDRFGGSNFDNVIHAHEEPELSRNIGDLIAELQNKAPRYRSVVRALMWEIICLLYRRHPEKTEVADEPEISREKLELVAPAIRLITLHYHDAVTVEEMAKRCKYSVSNFRKLFHAATGSSPSGYLQRLRLESAAAMLKNSDGEIFNIARKSGFPTLSNFNRQFKEYFGISPKECRRTTNVPPSKIKSAAY